MNTTCRIFLYFVVIALCGCASDQPRVYLVGDATMASYDPNVTQKCGWGQMLGQFAPAGVQVFNHAREGVASSVFYDDGSWAKVQRQIEPGDVVLIQFGHDDERGLLGCGAHKGAESPWETFRRMLCLFVDEARQAGARPILLQPVVRRFFDGNAITRKGAHDFSRTPGDVSFDFTAVIRSVADSCGVDLIDLCAISRGIVESYGVVGSKEQLYVEADNTNTAAKGAALFALAVAEALDTMDVWRGSVRRPQVVSSPVEIDFGRVFLGDTAWQALDLVDICGLTTLQPKVLTHHKRMTISAPAGFKVASRAGGVPQDSMSVLTDATASIFVSYIPKSTAQSVATLTVRTPDGEAKVRLRGGGRSVVRRSSATIRWDDVTAPLDDNRLSASLSSIRGLELADVGVLPLRGTWPSAPDKSEYVQMRITSNDKQLLIRNLSISSSPSQSFRVACSLGNDFYREIVMGQRVVSEVDNASRHRTDSFDTSIPLLPNQTILVRIYPASVDMSPDVKPFVISSVGLAVDTFE